MLRVLNGLVTEHFCFAFNYHQSALVTLDFRRTLPLKSKRLYFHSQMRQQNFRFLQILKLNIDFVIFNHFEITRQNKNRKISFPAKVIYV